MSRISKGPWFAGLCLLGLVLAARDARGQEPSSVPAGPHIVVTGAGEVQAAPDLAVVVIATESRSRNPNEAQQENARNMSRVQDRIRQSGIDRDDVRTISYDLQPDMEYSDGRRIVRGYIVRNTIEVTVNDLDDLGELLDRVVNAGATSIQGIRFDVKGRERLQREALRLAVADARARAEAAAAGAGQQIDRIWRIEESRGFVPPQMFRVQADVAAAATPIVAGDVELRSQVTLTATLR